MWKTYVEISYKDTNGNMTFIDETVDTHVSFDAIKYVYEKYGIAYQNTTNMRSFTDFQTSSELIYVGEE